jgi:hypothetical protein
MTPDIRLLGVVWESLGMQNFRHLGVDAVEELRTGYKFQKMPMHSLLFAWTQV